MSEVLAHNWVNDNIERQAALSLLRTMATQLELLGTPLERWRIPEMLKIQRFRPTERRVRLPSGEFGIYDEDTEDLRVQMPLKALKCNFFILSSVTDRSIINTSAMSWLIHKEFLVSARYGWFHALWNGIKKAMKCTRESRLWKCILGFLVVMNINFYPWRSSQAFEDKKSALRDYMACHTHASPSFESCAAAFARGLGLPLESESDARVLFEQLGKMRSFNEKGMLCKLQRWCSVQECWEYLRPEVAGAKVIYKEMGKLDDDLMPENGGTAASIDAPADDGSKKKETGKQYRRAHDWISPENMFFMDMLCQV